jgi:hypothetical protein
MAGADGSGAVAEKKGKDCAVALKAIARTDFPAPESHKWPEPYAWRFLQGAEGSHLEVL